MKTITCYAYPGEPFREVHHDVPVENMVFASQLGGFRVYQEGETALGKWASLFRYDDKGREMVIVHLEDKR